LPLSPPQLPPGRHLSIDGTLCLPPVPSTESGESRQVPMGGEAELPSRSWNGVGGERGASMC